VADKNRIGCVPGTRWNQIQVRQLALAVDKDGRYVVVELKVSRGYDRVVGQILRYMSWVEQNMDAPQKARGVIVANEITTDLKLAASRIPGIRLIEYEISFKLRPV
jgi:RecB family endonuclease NucS